MTVRHIITCEYPPQGGGVSDYTRLLAGGLAAAGEEVHVWCPAAGGRGSEQPGVTVHRDLGRFRLADLRRTDRALNAFRGPRRILLQWVPHGFGWRAMNLPLCAWLCERSARGDAVEVMFHEAFLEFRGSWRQHAAAAVHRLMTVLLLRAARRAWYAVPRQEALLRPYRLRHRPSFRWLPVPSNVPVVEDPAGAGALRRRYAAQGGLLMGHFGTYGSLIVELLRPVVFDLLRRVPRLSVLLLGRGGAAFRDDLIRARPALAARLSAPGALDAAALSRHVQACDLMLQPYPDGVSCRRTSFMAGLAHGKPIVTTAGHSTEPFWSESGAAIVVPGGDAHALTAATLPLLGDAARRRALGSAAARLYEERFTVERTVGALREAVS
jgi:glycosyltransferase involved in cell wall biosynthesis